MRDEVHDKGIEPWPGLLGLALIGWLGFELHLNRALPGPAGSATWAGVVSSRDRRPERPPLQLSGWGVALGDPISGIPYDRTGWDAQSGMQQPLVGLFAKDPDRLELELEMRDQEGAEVDLEAIQAKIGLETLERIGIERNEAGWRVRFAGPRQERYRTGVQVVFLATVPKERMLDRSTSWVLQRVQWQEPSLGSQMYSIADRVLFTVGGVAFDVYEHRQPHFAASNQLFQSTSGCPQCRR